MPDALAEALAPVFTEVVVAPGYDDDALATLTAKTNLRVLGAAPPGRRDPRRADRRRRPARADPDPVDDRPVGVVRSSPSGEPTPEQWDDLAFAWTVCAAVSLERHRATPRDGQAFGIGAGQQNRVDSARIAADRADGRAVGGGVRQRRLLPVPRRPRRGRRPPGCGAVIQPGGSVRDDEVIAAADEHGIAMVFTGERHFRH